MEERPIPLVWFSERFITRVCVNCRDNPTSDPSLKANITGWEYTLLDLESVKEKLTWNGYVWILNNTEDDCYPRNSYEGPLWRLGRWPD